MTSAAAVPRSHPGSPVRRSIAVRPSHAVGGGLRGLAAGATAVSLVAAGIAGQNLHLLGWIGDAMVGIFLIVLAMAVVSGALGVLGWIVRRAAVPRNGLPGPAPWIARLSSALADPLLAASLTIVAILALGREGGPLSFLGALVPFEIVIGLGALTGMIGGVGIVVAARGLRSDGADRRRDRRGHRRRHGDPVGGVGGDAGPGRREDPRGGGRWMSLPSSTSRIRHSRARTASRPSATAPASPRGERSSESRPRGAPSP